jgi:hypothetical protein
MRYYAQVEARGSIGVTPYQTNPPVKSPKEVWTLP